MAAPTRYPSGVSVANRGSNVTIEAPFKQLIIPISFADGTTANDTGFQLPANSIIWPVVVVNVRALEATGTTKTIDIGLVTGSGQELTKGLSVASTGLVKASVLKGSITLGDSLTVDSGVGADVATGAEIGILTTALNVNWTPGSADFAELEADIILYYQEVRSV